MIETVLIIVAVILLLVVSHELGHFLVAKWNNVRVDEFGVGIPPRIAGVHVGETLYSLNLLPFGGFVRIVGEDEDVNDARSFSRQSYAVKTFIVAAGVLANIFVGFLIFSFLAWYGTPLYAVQIDHVLERSPAAEAGLRDGDMIVGVGSERRNTLDMAEVLSYIDAHKGETALFTVRRGGEEFSISATPREHPPEGEGAMGIRIGPVESGIARAPWYRAPYEGMKTTVQTLGLLFYGMFLFFRDLFGAASVPGEVLGPVGIASVARDTFDIGMRYFLQLVAFLSLNLAVINILPIPALDGGRIFFFIIEKVKGSPIPARISHTVHSVFFILLLSLLAIVTYQDIVRLI